VALANLDHAPKSDATEVAKLPASNANPNLTLLASRHAHPRATVGEALPATAALAMVLAAH
jgi:hypothetical protein